MAVQPMIRRKTRLHLYVLLAFLVGSVWVVTPSGATNSLSSDLDLIPQLDVTFPDRNDGNASLSMSQRWWKSRPVRVASTQNIPQQSTTHRAEILDSPLDANVDVGVSQGWIQRPLKVTLPRSS
jgi:hypothetical protein